MRILTAADFTGRIGKSVTAVVGGRPIALKLAAVQELPSSAREGGAFRLEWLGPAQAIIPQGTYVFDLGFPTDIFIVPVGAEADAIRYEAIFF